MEWFESILNWFVINKDAIVAFVCSGSFAGLIANVFLVIKSMKKTDSNTKSNVELASKVESKQVVVDDVSDIKSDTKELRAVVDKLSKDNQLLMSKVSAMMDVFSLVYATIKDEPTRVAVLNILANAKYEETEQRRQLTEKLVTIKEQLTSKTQEIVDEVTEVVEQAQATVENKPTRY